MAQPGYRWRLRALEAVGYALLAPWLALHASLVAAGLGWSGGHAALAETPQAATLVLFVLPVLALTVGVAGLHSLLWNGRVRSLFGALVIVASLCLIGSVVSSVVGHARGGAAVAGATVAGGRAG